MELDLIKDRVEDIVLQIHGESILQRVIYEFIPPYCHDCKHIGHLSEDCYANGKNPRPPPRLAVQKLIGVVQKPERTAQASSSNPKVATRVSTSTSNPNSANPNTWKEIRSKKGKEIANSPIILENSNSFELLDME